MENKKIKLDFEMTIFDVVDLNKSFSSAKILIAYTGRNRNRSDIRKEAFLDALPSIRNIPIVGRYDVEKGDFGGHDIKVINKENNIEIVNATIPFGVVPESANQWFETCVVNGEEKECLFTDIVLWKRQHGYERIAKAETLGQSMEINVSSYVVDQDGYCIIDKFQFEALTILGDDVTPCFENACVQMYSNEIISDFKLQFSEMLEEFKMLEQNNINYFSQNINKKGGNVLDEKLVILEKYGKTIEDLDFSIDDMSTEDFEAKMKELFGENTETPVEPVQPVVSEPVAFSATYKQKRQALCNALDPIIVKDENGNYVEETYYYVEDFSDEWVYVEKSHWTVDNYEYKFGRFSYEFDETALTATITSDFEEMVKVWLTLEEKENLDKERAGYELMKTEFEQYKSEYTVTNAEFEELKSYKETKIAEERANAETELFAKYEGKIGETNEFKTLKEKASEYTLDALTKECLCIVGMYSMTSEPTETPKDNKDPLKFSVEQPVQEDEPYGGLMKKYLGR